MKTRILASFAIAGFLATSAAVAETLPVEELYSGLSTPEIQKIHIAAEQQPARKITCKWHEESEDQDLLYAAYPGDEYTEKDYLSPLNMNVVC